MISDISNIENAITREAVEGILSFGFSISVFDGEGYALKRSRNAEKIVAALHSTDEDYLHAFDGDRMAGWVHFIYGNDGYDVIADYTISLSSALAAANSLAELISADIAGMLE